MAVLHFCNRSWLPNNYAGLSIRETTYAPVVSDDLIGKEVEPSRLGEGAAVRPFQDENNICFLRPIFYEGFAIERDRNECAWEQDWRPYGLTCLNEPARDSDNHFIDEEDGAA
jgi:hypothetical protein